MSPLALAETIAATSLAETGDAPRHTPLPPAARGSGSGGVHFVAASRQADLCADLRARRFLVAPVAAPERGRLRAAIDDAVEGALAMRGALPPAVEVVAAIEPTIRDQVFRARALGAAGLALVLPRLGDAADHTLDVVDGIALSAWIGAAKRAPLVVVLDDADREACVLTPVSISELAGPSAAAPIEGAPPASGEVDAPAKAVPPPPVLTMPRRGVMKKRSQQRAEANDEVAGPPTLVERQAPPAIAIAEAKPREIERPAPPPPAVPTPAPPPVVEAAVEEHELAPPPVPARREGVARRAVDAAEWRQHAVDLDKARGPKPVSVIERLFVMRYMPLVGASSRGEVDGAVKSVVEAWRQTFEHSYREAFSALRVTGKRPPMVFDAPDAAARIARLNGARATKLVLVDAMRFDIGERVAELLKDKLAGRAVCVERMLLWSALPTTTPTQMALLARGADGLRDAEPASEPEPEIFRGRAVGTLRRDRVGAREVMKLDLVEARLRNAGPAYEERLESLAEEVAPILAKYVETLPPRTLVFLFGDHGFRLPLSADGRATGPATQGGVSPEEVLVPAQAWLVGGMH